jgi:hypothetical protein
MRGQLLGAFAPRFSSTGRINEIEVAGFDGAAGTNCCIRCWEFPIILHRDGMMSRAGSALVELTNGKPKRR